MARNLQIFPSKCRSQSSGRAVSHSSKGGFKDPTHRGRTRSTPIFKEALLQAARQYDHNNNKIARHIPTPLAGSSIPSIAAQPFATLGTGEPVVAKCFNSTFDGGVVLGGDGDADGGADGTAEGGLRRHRHVRAGPDFNADNVLAVKPHRTGSSPT
ncbi:hypothetical protein MAPG_06321 [Magnaporthiopsis poae ATCC 64411]|uniref:Uncharacterized protein n=1 Tax=Magnaporthiopsis poae (strain ATCC 64411 / 73-15) TaxID=644358 RepID=A0A0C4E1Q4_MAGP6|nr:hypothetical protein MAPG_06321 [Magnaporthiopsis poae ATCC 64411]